MGPAPVWQVSSYREDVWTHIETDAEKAATGPPSATLRGPSPSRDLTKPVPAPQAAQPVALRGENVQTNAGGQSCEDWTHEGRVRVWRARRQPSQTRPPVPRPAGHLAMVPGRPSAPGHFSPGLPGALPRVTQPGRWEGGGRPSTGCRGSGCSCHAGNRGPRVRGGLPGGTPSWLPHPRRALHTLMRLISNSTVCPRIRLSLCHLVSLCSHVS